MNGFVPRKLYRASFSPPAALSRRNENSPRANFSYALTGVSVSPSSVRQTGTTLPCLDRAMNSSRSGL